MKAVKSTNRLSEKQLKTVNSIIQKLDNYNKECMNDVMDLLNIILNLAKNDVVCIIKKDSKEKKILQKKLPVKKS